MYYYFLVKSITIIYTVMITQKKVRRQNVIALYAVLVLTIFLIVF